MADTSRPCGPHTTLSDNDAARITQCPCGAVHVQLRTAGVTVQLSSDRFHQVGLAVMGAVSALGSRTAGPLPSTPDAIN